MSMRKKLKPSVFLALRSQLISSLEELDEEISSLLPYRRSRRAADRARALLLRRDELVEELWDYGIQADPHPAMEQLR